jgi:hypothetical protein
MLGQKCGPAKACHTPMRAQVDPPKPQKPAKDYVGEAKDYDSILARIGKGKKK